MDPRIILNCSLALCQVEFIKQQTEQSLGFQKVTVYRTMSFERIFSNPITNEIFAATENGLYSSTDGGKTFKLKGLSGFHILSAAFDPIDKNYIYVGTYKKGFYKSEDGGDTWKRWVKK